MPTIDIFYNRKNDFKSLEYESGKETLGSIIRKFDSNVDEFNTLAVIGNDIFNDWNVSLNTVLAYDTSIRLMKTIRQINLVLYDRKNPGIWSKSSIGLKKSQFKKVKDLKNDISSRYSLPYDKIILFHDDIEINDDSAALSDVLKHSEIKIPIDSSFFDHESINITVETLTGKSIFINIKRHETIEDLKLKICNVEGIPVDQQRIIYNREQLVNEYSLEAYNVHNKATLHLILRLRGGGPGWSAMEEPKVYQWSNIAPDWRIVKAGLCLEGTCSNSLCKAYGQMVIINMETPVLYMVNMNESKTNCPMCDQFVKPILCGFNRCEWRCVGTKKDMSSYKSEWKRVGDEYHRFEDKDTEWLSLCIETRVDKEIAAYYERYCGSKRISLTVDIAVFEIALIIDY